MPCLKVTDFDLLSFMLNEEYIVWCNFLNFDSLHFQWDWNCFHYCRAWNDWLISISFWFEIVTVQVFQYDRLRGTIHSVLFCTKNCTQYLSILQKKKIVVFCMLYSLCSVYLHEGETNLHFHQPYLGVNDQDLKIFYVLNVWKLCVKHDLILSKFKATFWHMSFIKIFTNIFGNKRPPLRSVRTFNRY